MDSAPFSRRVVVGVLVIGVFSVLLTLTSLIFGERWATVRSSGTDAFSYSALGHRGLVELLDAMEIPVVVGRSTASVTGTGNSLLLIAEPPLEVEDVDHLLQRQSTSERILYVLPKRTGEESTFAADGWIDSSELISLESVREVVERAELECEPVRVSATDVRWTDSPLGVSPMLEPVQLLRGAGLQPILECDAGILLGMRPAGRPGDSLLYVLSDPDLIANHGIGQGDNAELCVAIMRHLVPPGHAIVFDETLHGHELEPNVWEALLRFPLVLATLPALLAALTLVWSGTVRFGSPLDATPDIASGKRALIDNTAELLRSGGHEQVALQRYLECNLRHVAEAFHLSQQLTVAQRDERLKDIGGTRGVDGNPEQLRANLEELRLTKRLPMAEIVETAERIHVWREEMIHGPE
jgi:hypothetical protein